MAAKKNIKLGALLVRLANETPAKIEDKIMTLCQAHGRVQGVIEIRHSLNYRGLDLTIVCARNWRGEAGKPKTWQLDPAVWQLNITDLARVTHYDVEQTRADIIAAIQQHIVLGRTWGEHAQHRRLLTSCIARQYQ